MAIPRVNTNPLRVRHRVHGVRKEVVAVSSKWVSYVKRRLEACKTVARLKACAAELRGRMKEKRKKQKQRSVRKRPLSTDGMCTKALSEEAGQCSARKHGSGLSSHRFTHPLVSARRMANSAWPFAILWHGSACGNMMSFSSRVRPPPATRVLYHTGKLCAACQNRSVHWYAPSL